MRERRSFVALRDVAAWRMSLPLTSTFLRACQTVVKSEWFDTRKRITCSGVLSFVGVRGPLNLTVVIHTHTKRESVSAMSQERVRHRNIEHHSRDRTSRSNSVVHLSGYLSLCNFDIPLSKCHGAREDFRLLGCFLERWKVVNMSLANDVTKEGIDLVIRSVVEYGHDNRCNTTLLISFRTEESHPKERERERERLTVCVSGITYECWFARVLRSRDSGTVAIGWWGDLRKHQWPVVCWMAEQ